MHCNVSFRSHVFEGVSSVGTSSVPVDPEQVPGQHQVVLCTELPKSHALQWFHA